jgi:hypothetical protein
MVIAFHRFVLVCQIPQISRKRHYEDRGQRLNSLSLSRLNAI